MANARVILVSNRLPVSLDASVSPPVLNPSSGGLATALRDVHGESGAREAPGAAHEQRTDASDSTWVGWLGDSSGLTPEDADRIAKEASARRLVPVTLSSEEISLYYDGYSNAVLWPLFHYLLDKVKLDAAQEWQAYKTVNARFAEVAKNAMAPGDTVWIHDYQLMLVPSYLRALRPDARIGFFLHVPWPSADVFRILPARSEILASLLSCDLVGFHTESYRHNFIHSAAKILGVELGIDAVIYGDRTVRIGVYPISIDVATFEQASDDIDSQVAQIRARTPDKKILLGVDRLDYTKGVPRRLLAFARLLEREPELSERVHYIQLAVPTRENVEAYAELRSSVNELVGRINAKHGTPTDSPIHLLYRSVDNDALLALYRAADVMLVTPLRDGMNLVAKEYVAARTDEQGVLVLSEFAGAAAELDAALIINPYDIDGTASAIRRALTMTRAEQRVRMRKLRAAVHGLPVARWAQGFLDDLASTEPVNTDAYSSPDEIARAIERMQRARSRVFLFDYDGTLVPIAPLPDLASPDESLIALLRRLAATPNTEVHILSGRSRESLSEWLSDLPAQLHAEHGFWSRDGQGTWREAVSGAAAFLPEALSIMGRHAKKTPGAFVEQKSASVAFHYRGSDPHLAAARLLKLREELLSTLGTGAELLDGHKVLEVRPRGVHKGIVVQRIREHLAEGAVLFAAGDDRTDEDLFSALPEDAISVRVGPGRTRARLRIPGPTELRRILSAVAS